MRNDRLDHGLEPVDLTSTNSKRKNNECLLTFRCTRDFLDKLDDYQEREHIRQRSFALKKLITLGYQVFDLICKSESILINDTKMTAKAELDKLLLRQSTVNDGSPPEIYTSLDSMEECKLRYLIELMQLHMSREEVRGIKLRAASNNSNGKKGDVI